MNKEMIDRRAFLSRSASLAVAGAIGTSMLTSCGKGNKLTPLREEGTYLIPEISEKAIPGRELKVGLVGCGGRGRGALQNLLDAADGITIAGFADLFEDKVENCIKKLKDKAGIDASAAQRFVGFDAYKQLIDSGVDMVILATPPAFRPEQFQYATQKGVHSFLEKPIAIDPKGYRTVMATAKQAEAKGLSVVTGTQRHHQRNYVESFKKIQEGWIGEITGGNVYWNQGQNWFVSRKPEQSDMEYMLRDWLNWTWLSGDMILEQHVHNIDVFMWMTGLKPVSASAVGARVCRPTGNGYDFFSVDFTMENGCHMHSMCRQINGCDGNVSEFIQGTKGSWCSTRDGKMNICDLEGNELWAYQGGNFEQDDPYVLEHVEWVNHIRRGEAYDEATLTGLSCLAGVMGREAAYTGKKVTWDEMSASEMCLMPQKLELGPADMAFFSKVPVPGTDK